MQHVTIYREAGRFAGWPANNGIWSWGDEIVVAFTLGYHDAAGGFHSRDRSRPFISMQARSLDGGQTWEAQKTPCRVPGNRRLTANELDWVPSGNVRSEQVAAQKSEAGKIPVNCPDGIDFSHPDFAIMCTRSGLKTGAKSWFYISYDRCRKWDGPFMLPMFGQPGIAARTDYLVSSAEECTLFLTAAKTNGDEGRVFCARTTDAGKTFKFLSWITPEPEGYAIMPASVRLSESRILVAVRYSGRKQDSKERQSWIDLYASDDNGATWSYMNRPVPDTGRGGNPPTLTKLHDGRLCLAHGHRDAPYSMCARLSSDDGATWGEKITLRDDGGNHDIGYPRTVQRLDGTIVTIYYFNDHPDGERHIAATLWKP